MPSSPLSAPCIGIYISSRMRGSCRKIERWGWESACGGLAPPPQPSPQRNFIHGVPGSACDSNHLHAAAADRGYQLLAPPRRRGAGLGHCRHHPARLIAQQQLTTLYGQRLCRPRAEIDREFGHRAPRQEGLDELPAHVRRLHRIKLFVIAKLILNAFRILLNYHDLTQNRS